MLCDNIKNLEKGIEVVRDTSEHIFNKRFERGDKTLVKRSDLENTKKEAAFVKEISGVTLLTPVRSGT